MFETVSHSSVRPAAAGRCRLAAEPADSLRCQNPLENLENAKGIRGQRGIDSPVNGAFRTLDASGGDLNAHESLASRLELYY